jgi:ATP-dependent Clp protease ATP-binding subunit ClpC
MPKETSFLQKLTFHARHSMKEARDIARYARSTSLEPEHLLLAILLENGSLGNNLLANMGFEKEKLAPFCLEKKTPGATFPESTAITLSGSMRDLMQRAFAIAREFHFPYVGTEHLVYALIEVENQRLDDIFVSLDIDEKKIEAALSANMNFDHFPQLARMFDNPQGEAEGKQKKPALAALSQYAEEITGAGRPGSELLSGRDQELGRMVQILLRKQKSNPLLIGEPGVGKTALVNRLAEEIRRGSVPEELMGKRIFSLDLALVVAGTNFRGEFESRLKDILREATSHEDVILFIDEIHTLVGAGNTSGGLDAANILKPALARGDIQAIGATTLTEFKRHIEKDPALERRFQSVFVDEPTPALAKAMLRHSKPSYEDYHQVVLDNAITDRAVELAVRHMPERFLPDKAFDLIDEAAALAKQEAARQDRSADRRIKLRKRLSELEAGKEAFVEEEAYEEAARFKEEAEEIRGVLEDLKQKNRREKRVAVEESHLLTTLARLTGIPEAKLKSPEPVKRFEKLKKALRSKVVGQKNALEALEAVLLRSLSNIHDPERPMGSLLFLGPTGVGKTLVAKVLAEEFFNDKKALIRLDMSEFMERHSVAQIIGAPAGYVGYGEGGKLTEQVRRRPHSVVLFDEIEKAHPDVFNILLQILDEGALTDAEGRRVSFQNTLVILTSNIGSDIWTREQALGFEKEGRLRHAGKRLAVLESLKKILRPELLSRIEHTLVFDPMTPASLKQIARLELRKLAGRLSERGVTLRFDPSVAAFVASEAAASEQGARLVRKIIQERVERAVAEALLHRGSPESLALAVRAQDETLLCEPAKAQVS